MFRSAQHSLASLWLSVVLAGCGQATIDTSSEERYRESIQAAKTSLSEDKQKEFEQALVILAFADVVDGEDANPLAALADLGGAQRRVMEKVKGKTAAEVLNLASDAKSARMKKELQTLEAKQSSAAASAELLGKFKINKSRLDTEEGLTVEINATNGTTHPISAVYFNAIVTSPGRSVPWVSEPINFDIEGGIEPGESSTWRIDPGFLGSLEKTLKDRNDLVLTLTVRRLDGADGKPLCSELLTPKETARLKELRAGAAKN